VDKQRGAAFSPHVGIGETGCRSPPGLRRNLTDRSHQSVGAFETSLWGVDGAREAIRRFEAKRQFETESVVEFEQALRVLYWEAWSTGRFKSNFILPWSEFVLGE